MLDGSANAGFGIGMPIIVAARRGGGEDPAPGAGNLMEPVPPGAGPAGLVAALEALDVAALNPDAADIAVAAVRSLRTRSRRCASGSLSNFVTSTPTALRNATFAPLVSMARANSPAVA